MRSESFGQSPPMIRAQANWVRDVGGDSLTVWKPREAAISANSAKRRKLLKKSRFQTKWSITASFCRVSKSPFSLGWCNGGASTRWGDLYFRRVVPQSSRFGKRFPVNSAVPFHSQVERFSLIFPLTVQYQAKSGPWLTHFESLIPLFGFPVITLFMIHHPFWFDHSTCFTCLLFVL